VVADAAKADAAARVGAVVKAAVVGVVDPAVAVVGVDPAAAAVGPVVMRARRNSSRTSSRSIALPRL
jgi:hypothetical protein